MTSEKESQQSIVDSDQIRSRAATPQAKQRVFLESAAAFISTYPTSSSWLNHVERLVAIRL